MNSTVNYSLFSQSPNHFPFLSLAFLIAARFVCGLVLAKWDRNHRIDRTGLLLVANEWGRNLQKSNNQIRKWL